MWQSYEMACKLSFRDKTSESLTMFRSLFSYFCPNDRCLGFISHAWIEYGYIIN